MRLNFDASSVLHPTSARSKTRSSPEYSTQRISFPRFFHSEFSVLFYTQNRKLGVENLGVFSKGAVINYQGGSIASNRGRVMIFCALKKRGLQFFQLSLRGGS